MFLIIIIISNIVQTYQLRGRGFNLPRIIGQTSKMCKYDSRSIVLHPIFKII